MIYRMLFSCTTAAATVGCALLPEYSYDYRIPPEVLSARVQCELKIAAEEHRNDRFDLDDYAAGYTLALKVEAETNPNAKIDWTIPVPTPKSLSIGASAGITDNILRDGSIQFASFDIKNLGEQSCPEGLHEAYERDGEAAMIIYGSFGIIDWIGRMSKAVNENDPMTAPIKADYTLRFMVTASASATPTYKIVNLSTVAGLPLKRINTHTLTLALSKNKKASPQKVCVVNMGRSCDPPPTPPPAKPKPKITRDLTEIGKKIETGEKKKAAKTTKRPVRRPSGVDPGTRQQIEQQLDLLRLRDVLRP